MLKYFGGGIILLILLIGFVGWGKYQDIYAANVPDTLEDNLLQIPSNTSFGDLVFLGWPVR